MHNDANNNDISTDYLYKNHFFSSTSTPKPFS